MNIKFIIIIITLLIGCSIGPISIIPREGRLPKVEIDTPIDECKVKPKLEEVSINCQWEVDF